MLRIQCVLFDIGGVLLTLGEQAYRDEVARYLGLDAIPASFEKYVPMLQRGETTTAAVWKELGKQMTDDVSYEAIFLKYFKPIGAMLKFAAELRREGITTAILSNTEESHVRAMRTLGFLDEFDPLFLSCEVGMRKPEPDVYEHVVNTLAIPAGAIIYIDDVAEYVEAGTRLGMHGILHRGDLDATIGRVRSMIGGSR